MRTYSTTYERDFAAATNPTHRREENATPEQMNRLG